MEFILLHRKTDCGNYEMLLNVHCILRIEEISSSTYVFMNNGENFIVEEGIDELKKKLIGGVMI